MGWTKFCKILYLQQISVRPINLNKIKTEE